MAKIQRKTQKIFGGNAASDQLAAFGSMVSGTPIYTDDVETLQTAKYEQGWDSAVAGGNSPFMEEMNGVQYGLSKQIAYVLQQGIPEWDENTTYYALTSWVQITGVFYQSLTDENTGNNPVDDNVNWKAWKFIDIATDEQAESGEVENVAVNPRQMREAINEALVGALQYKGEWVATNQVDYSSIELPVKAGYMYYVTGSATIGNIEWNSGDYLIINEDVAVGETITNVQEIDNTESSDIVRLDAEQTLTNKTISADDNNITDLTPDNFKAGTAFVTQDMIWYDESTKTLYIGVSKP